MGLQSPCELLGRLNSKIKTKIVVIDEQHCGHIDDYTSDDSHFNRL